MRVLVLIGAANEFVFSGLKMVKDNSLCCTFVFMGTFVVA